jgi:sterol desaturase/sphingolipid hydroxylase (fatty acid hydroxylase superfamily)
MPRSALTVLAQVAQWAALFAAPQVLWRPRWAALVDAADSLHHSPGIGTSGAWVLNVFGNAAVSALTLAVLNALFYLLYRARSPAVEAFRVRADRPWPWDAGAAEAAAFAGVFWRGAALAALNAALAVPLGAAGWAGVKALGYSAAAADFPSALTMAWQFAAFLALEDALFYWGHRALHSPLLYARVHKVHHAFTHSVSIAATATHLVEFMLSNVVPFVAGPTLLGAHCATIYLWTIYRTAETVVHHSGYEFPALLFHLLPFQGGAEEHDDHHSKNVGNFGSQFVLWDAWCGTRIPPAAAPKAHAQ